MNGDTEEYILMEDSVMVVSNTQFDENGAPLMVEISYEEFNLLNI